MFGFIVRRKQGHALSRRVAENRKAHSTFDFQLFGWQPHHMHIFPRPTSLSLHFVHATRHFNAFITRIHTFLSNLIESSEHFLHGRKMGEPRNLEKRGNEWSRDVPQQPIWSTRRRRVWLVRGASTCLGLEFQQDKIIYIYIYILSALEIQRPRAGTVFEL